MMEPKASGGYRRLWRLCQKELKETVRDRRTVITLLLMPLLVYPILSMALNRFVLSSAGESSGFVIGVESNAELQQMDKWLGDPMSLPPESILQASDGELAQFRAVVIDEISIVEALEQNLIDVGVKIEQPPGLKPTVTFSAYRGDGVSQTARRVLVERLQWMRLSSATDALKQAVPEYTDPIRVQVANVGHVAPPSLLGTIVPLDLLHKTITGAVYPAIDLTAGERERGTMESVMASPVSRGAVLFSKYVAVVIVALLTALVNLTAMFTTLWAGGLMPLLTGDDSFPWIAVLRVLGLLILFSGFYSALLLSLTSFAKSFKEAQAYLIPVMLVSLAPAMLSLLPGASLRGGLAITPLINIVLLARDLLTGSVDSVGALAAVVSTIAYAAAALMIAARLFGSDAVTRTSERSIGSVFRRPKQLTAVPTPQAAALMLALLVPVYFLISNGLMRFLERFRDGITVEALLTLNAAALIVSFGTVPLLAAIIERNRLSTTYRTVLPSGLTSIGFVLIGSVLIGLGAWAFAHEAFVLADAIGIGGLGADQIEQAERSVSKMREASPWLLLAVFVVAPAVIEELCFRGYLFSSFRAVMSPVRTIGVTAILFGLFHVLTGSALLIERFIPSTLMGLLIGWVAYRTGSVFPGVVVHFVHNGLLMMVLYYQERRDFLGDGFDNQTHLPIAWIAGAALLVAVGAVFVIAGTKVTAGSSES
jgi:sodium transport system permease protein